MSVATVKKVITSFLKEKNFRVLALKGGWGVGKTYAWREFVLANKKELFPEDYAYVSLFGVASISDLRMAIIANTQPRETIGEKLTFEVVNQKWTTIAPALIARLINRAGGEKAGGLLKGLNVAVEVLAPALIRNTLICLDDLERLNKEKIPHDVLMGFISNLKETCNCKIALILNDQELPTDADAFDKYREKVVDLEVEYRPTVQEAIGLGLSSAMNRRDSIAAMIVSLGIRNIRILKRIEEYSEMIEPCFQNLHPDVARAAIPSLVLLTWCFFDRSGDAPSLEFVKSYNWATSVIKKKPKDGAVPPSPDTDKPPSEQMWIDALRSIGFATFEEVDAAILKMVQQGYLEESGVVEELAKRDQAATSGDLESRLIKAWAGIRDSFGGDENAILLEVIESTKAATPILSPNNLNGVVVLLRELDMNAIADELIEFYIAQRNEDLRVFDLEESAFGSDVTDAVLREKFAAHTKTIAKEVSLREAIETISRRKGWSKEDQAALNAASAEELYEVFKGDLSVSAEAAARGCLQFDSSPYEGIAQNATEALLKIAKESPLNAARVRRLGIDTEAEAEGAGVRC